MRLESSRPCAGISPSDLWELMWRRDAQSRWLAPAAPVTHLEGPSLRAGGRGRDVAHGPGQARAATAPGGGAPAGAGMDGGRDDDPGHRGDPRREGERGAGGGVGVRGRRPVRGRPPLLGAGPGPPAGARGRAVGRRDDVRQAVVVIHGIGEQQPGRTLRSLVASGAIGDPAAQAAPGSSPTAVRVLRAAQDDVPGQHRRRAPDHRPLRVLLGAHDPRHHVRPGAGVGAPAAAARLGPAPDPARLARALGRRDRRGRGRPPSRRSTSPRGWRSAPRWSARRSCGAGSCAARSSSSSATPRATSSRSPRTSPSARRSARRAFSSSSDCTRTATTGSSSSATAWAASSPTTS